MNTVDTVDRRPRGHGHGTRDLVDVLTNVEVQV
jgi:hypothetical protein